MHKTQLRILALVVSLLLIFLPSQQVMGMLRDHLDQNDFSGALYTFHGDQQVGVQLSEGSCVNCHMNPQASSFRNMMASLGVDCTGCHGKMTVFNQAGRISYSRLPTCNTCHPQAISTSIGVMIGQATSLTGCSSEIKMSMLNKHQHHDWPMDSLNELLDCSACHTLNQTAAFWHFGMEQ